MTITTRYSFGHRKPPRLYVCGLFLAALLAIAACGSDDEDQSSDDGGTAGSTPSSVAEPTTATTEQPSAASTADDGRVAAAVAYWTALASGDREAAMSVVDPAVLAQGGPSPFGRAGTLDGQFDWYESVGWEWTLVSCEENAGAMVECTATARNTWSEALGVEPVSGTFAVSFSDGGIADVADQEDSFLSQWSPMVFGVFAMWVDTNHPEDAAIMFDFATDVNAEILGLYEVNTTRFVEAQDGG